MLIFGLDTCCMPATAALCDDEKLVAEFVLNCGKTHSQKIMPQIENMLAGLGIVCSDIDCFAAANGPGSFTGVRIGAATLKAMAHAFDKPCVTVSTLMALAQNVMYFPGIICPILDARRNQVYTAMFEGGKDGLGRMTEDAAMGLDELLTELKAKDREVLFLGDGIFVHRDRIISELGDKANFAPPNLNMNMAGSVAFLGMQAFKRGETKKYSEVVPSYIRLSQAERERLMGR
ncbi:MAG: tRNA (adenosine(37)-N6)-threonylcarbamoyltransferase complex dimerization subunit type 1 TsaB [Clostridiales bacterium]|nr:tRNA (adenosine(37)-N6)-threonylcarbamoyltransferase complex dimerization subunit type 1 TsaB [Clostridiales bacterium]